ncbi:camp-dependent protein kinase 10 [Halteromyces radiatus]|uniref:camp-dependent protein kinase 10 n=1 Tax=Halteromyces radiatus TaxID=101107 RepID=UPI0022201643|nr:camp-dependent protein kinase 10 [Halteromyces radiatus]KAI8093288.1 camp-dependent protein kinase 10 [Halteromyces radiatus]
MPLRFLSTLVSSLLRRSNSNDCIDPIDSHSTQKPPSTNSITFSSTVTIQNLFSSKKSDDNIDTTTISSFGNHDTKNWLAHQEQLSYWQQQSSVFEKEPLTRNVNDYTLLDTLGTGTFGRVYLAKEQTQNKVYAIKVLKKADVVRLKQVEHINSERYVLSRVHFPFIVQLHCTFQDQQCLYMVQEYVLGGELFRHLRRAGRFGNDTTRFYAAEIVLAIEYLHSKDIIYRDLKPENLLLDREGHIKITDFGFAKKVTDRTWTLCGTPEYLAPEVIQSKGHGKAVDWWSLGILIFEMLAGYPPFYDDNHFGIYERILGGKVQYPGYLETSAKDLLKRLLVIDRTRRLGNLKGGADDIKMHKWFRGTDWLGLLKKSARAPFIPAYSSDQDTSNFEKYPAEAEHVLSDINEDPYKSLFADF